VKYLICYIIFPLVLLATSANAYNNSDYSPIRADDTSYIAAQTNTKDNRPFNFAVNGDYIFKTNIKREHHNHLDWDHRKFQYAEVFADAGMIFYYNECKKEGLGLTLEYSLVDFDFKTNPFFKQQYFHTGTLSLGGFTERFKRWTIKAQAAANVDTHTWNFNEYLTLDFLLWGRYQLCKNIGFHTGFLIATGMKIDRVYPIVGIDWQATKKLKINLVYPVDVSAVYQFNCNWSVSAAGRLIFSRHRASEHTWVPKSLFVYQTAGGELGLNYDSKKWINANIHAGYTFSGRVTLADRHYHHKEHFRVDPSAYVGGEVELKF